MFFVAIAEIPGVLTHQLTHHDPEYRNRNHNSVRSINMTFTFVHSEVTWAPSQITGNFFFDHFCNNNIFFLFYQNLHTHSLMHMSDVGTYKSHCIHMQWMGWLPEKRKVYHSWSPLFNSLFRLKTKITSKLCITGLSWREFTGDWCILPHKRPVIRKTASISWRHYSISWRHYM